MDIAAFLAKIAGVVLLGFTIRSIFIHVKEKQQEMQKDKDKKDDQSVSEQILNNILLYLWLVFMLVFSSGLVLNN